MNISGISEDGKNDRYSDEELECYKKAVNDKIMLHRKHGTKLIYTFSSYKDNRSLIEHLKEKLEVCGIELRPRNNKKCGTACCGGRKPGTSVSF